MEKAITNRQCGLRGGMNAELEKKMKMKMKTT